MIGILHVVGLLVGLTVNIDDTILDLQRLTRQTDTALYIVFTTICRTGVYHAILLLVLHNSLTSSLIDGIEI